MQGVFDSFKEIFRLSFNKGFVWRTLALSIIELVIILALGALALGAAIAMVLAGSFSLSSLAIASAILLALFFVITAIGAVISAICLALGRDCIEGRQLSISSAYEKAKPGMFPLLKIQLAVSMLFILLFLALVAPGVAKLSAAFQDYGLLGITNSMQAIIIPFISAVAAVLLVYIVLLPFLLVISQAAFFERLGIFQAMRRAYALGKRNFLDNWGFFLVVAAASVVAMLVVVLLSAGITLAGGNSIITVAINLAIRIIAQVWVGVLAALFSVKIYMRNLQAVGARIAKPKAPSASKPRKGRARKKKK